MPHLLSTEGPALAVGDVDGRRARRPVRRRARSGSRAALLVQRRDGTLPRARRSRRFAADSLAEDVDAAFFDADGDGDLDLYVVSGGNEFWGRRDALRDRLVPQRRPRALPRDVPDALPAVFARTAGASRRATSTATATWTCSSAAAWCRAAYGRIPRSHLLRNDGKRALRGRDARGRPGARARRGWCRRRGVDRRATATARSTSSWSGEWMPVRVFRQERGTPSPIARAVGARRERGVVEQRHGRRRERRRARRTSCSATSGCNAYVRASGAEPARLYVGRLLRHGHAQADPDLLQAGRPQLPGGGARRAGAADAAAATVAIHRTRRSGRARWTRSSAPANLRKATMSPARTFAIGRGAPRGTHSSAASAARPRRSSPRSTPRSSDDFDGDGTTDLCSAATSTGCRRCSAATTPVRASCSAGGTGRCVPADPGQSGMTVDGEVRAMAIVRRAGGGRLLAVARNNASLQLFPLPR